MIAEPLEQPEMAFRSAQIESVAHQPASSQTLAPAGSICECCGKSDSRPFVRKRGYVLRRCESCGVAFVSPQPTLAELRTLYSRESGYFATANTDLAALPPSSNQWLHELLVGVGVDGRRFLDVGCATGQLMYHMRAFGWEVRGCDVNADAVQVAVQNGLDARVATMEEYDIPPDSVDVANLGDLIEHVPSPASVVRGVHAALRPGGLIVIRTPNNRNGFARWTARLSRLTGLPWAHSEAPYHLWEFSPASLEMLLARLGFDVVKTQCAGHSSFGYRLGASGFFDDLKARMKRSGGYRLNARLIWNLPKLLAIGSLLAPCYAMARVQDYFADTGDSLLMVARKKQPLASVA